MKLYKSYILKFSIIFVVIALDLILKHFLYGSSVSLIPYVLGVRPAHALNTGGAWGVLGSSMWLLVAFTIIFLIFVVILEVKWRNSSPMYSISISLIVGGAVGNLVDRVSLGGVRDFLYFEFWQQYPTFNLADVCLCVGMLLMAIYIIFVYKSGENNQKS